MKCPNCGYEMDEGKLYCENCGEDIHIVPDFEPDLDLRMQSNLNGIVQKIEDTTKPQDESGRKQNKTFTKTIIVVLLALLTGCVIASILFVIIIRHHHESEEYKINKAAQFFREGNFEKASELYEALLNESSDIEIRFQLAESYFELNKKEEYESLLKAVITDENATDEQLDRAYGKLIAVYRSKEDNRAVAELLSDCKNPHILDVYRDYVANAPSFSLKEGYYSGVQPLKITSEEEGIIYYTLDGTTPDKDSIQYFAPILLEDGEYTVKAVFCNPNGIFSDIVTMEYHIENDGMTAPVISVISGDYNKPMLIEVLNDTEDIYYTTDNTVPVSMGLKYTGPIPMPLGKSTFRFAKVIDGVEGEVTERTYRLTPDADYNQAEAVQDLLARLLENGKVTDSSGHFNDTEDKYRFYYHSFVTIPESGDFYVIEEKVMKADGTEYITGVWYAVDIHTKEIFRLQQDSENRYNLIEI